MNVAATVDAFAERDFAQAVFCNKKIVLLKCPSLDERIVCNCEWFLCVTPSCNHERLVNNGHVVCNMSKKQQHDVTQHVGVELMCCLTKPNLVCNAQ